MFSLLTAKSYKLLAPTADAALCYFRKFEDSKSIFEIEKPIAQLLQKGHHYEKKKILTEVIGQIRAWIQNFISGLSGANQFQEHIPAT